MITTVTREQFFTAVAAVNGMDTLYQYIPMDTNSPVWIDFDSAKYVSVGDQLYIATQMALNYTTDQMITLFNAAVQVPV